MAMIAAGEVLRSSPPSWGRGRERAGRLSAGLVLQGARQAALGAGLGLASLAMTWASVGLAYDLALSQSGQEPVKAKAARQSAAYGAAAVDSAGSFQLLRLDLIPAVMGRGETR